MFRGDVSIPSREQTFGESISTSALLRLVLLYVKPLLESIHTPAGIDQLLFTGIKRMTLGTDFDPDVLACRSGLYYLAAGAGYGGVFIFGMGILFHNFHLLNLKC